MSKYPCGVLVAAMLAACSGGGSDAEGEAGGGIGGPFPKTIEGTIGYSYPLEDGSGRVLLGLLEYDNAVIIVSAETYDAKGMEEEDAEFSLDVEPLSGKECGDAEQCFRGF